jgi:hypothetical protein
VIDSDSNSKRVGLDRMRRKALRVSLADWCFRPYVWRDSILRYPWIGIDQSVLHRPPSQYPRLRLRPQSLLSPTSMGITFREFQLLARPPRTRQLALEHLPRKRLEHTPRGVDPHRIQLPPIRRSGRA